MNKKQQYGDSSSPKKKGVIKRVFSDTWSTDDDELFFKKKSGTQTFVVDLDGINKQSKKP